jgi:hypothetical protein
MTLPAAFVDARTTIVNASDTFAAATNDAFLETPSFPFTCRWRISCGDATASPFGGVKKPYRFHDGAVPMVLFRSCVLIVALGLPGIGWPAVPRL